jgi:pyrrolidone-carboxylate peptidase
MLTTTTDAVQPFKSFLINPSWLIASALPDELYPHPSSSAATKSPAYKIALIVHPAAIRVSYSTVSTTVPALVSSLNPDFILHIGMAGGRDCYSLETRAHRDNYRIKDVDDADGMTWGEQRWRRENVPEVLYVGWEEGDVLRRWEEGVKTGLAERGFLGRAEMERERTQREQSQNAPAPTPTSVPVLARGHGPVNLMWGTSNVPASATKADEHRRKAVVKLSADAGRFLCEYALFESLSRRWVDARAAEDKERDPAVAAAAAAAAVSAVSASGSPPSPLTSSPVQREIARERLGKVAFLHVPGWTGVEDINRGVMVAEEAIRALVGSWEDGYRRNGRVEAKAYTQQHSEEKGRVAASSKP